jgi:hypothetical protein
MKYNFFLLSIFIFINSINLAQIENDSIIYWSKNRKLKWHDFQAKLVDSAFITNDIAVTSSIINWFGYLDNGKPNYKVLVYFKKLKSWTKDTNSIYILTHEQMHFNLSEIYARKIRQAIKTLRKTNNANFNDYEKTINQIIKEFQISEENYDHETNHSRNKTKQLKWENNIKIQLKSLEDYELDYEVLLKND